MPRPTFIPPKWELSVSRNMQITHWVLSLVQVNTIQNWRGQSGRSPNEGCKFDQRAGEPVLRGITEGIWSVHSGEEKAQGDLIIVFLHIKGSYREDRGTLFTWRHVKMRGNRHKIYWEGSPLDRRKNVFLLVIENNPSLEQPPHGQGRIPIAGSFQNTIGQVFFFFSNYAALRGQYNYTNCKTATSLTCLNMWTNSSLMAKLRRSMSPRKFLRVRRLFSTKNVERALSASSIS